jgi:DNA (cytosine-5)-methyltransferase 1
MIGSLFSGIGGLEMGLELAGFGPVAWQCEADAFCRSVLRAHWNCPIYPDIKELRDVSADVVCGGFPCQDLSTAGRKAGFDGARSGLWFEMLRVIREARPRAVVVENVWNAKKTWVPVVRGGGECRWGRILYLLWARNSWRGWRRRRGFGRGRIGAALGT